MPAVTARSVTAVALAEAQSVVLPAVPSCHDSTLQLLSSTCPRPLISQHPPGGATFPCFLSALSTAALLRSCGHNQSSRQSVGCKSIPVLCKRTQCSSSDSFPQQPSAEMLCGVPLSKLLRTEAVTSAACTFTGSCFYVHPWSTPQRVLSLTSLSYLFNCFLKKFSALQMMIFKTSVWNIDIPNELK